jgi:hypothetical protein
LVPEVLLAHDGGEVGGGWSGHGGARRSRRRRGLGFLCSSLFMEFRGDGEMNWGRRGGETGIGAHWCVAAEETLHGGGVGAGGRTRGASVLHA